jgi:DNA-binding response OmpR family regulator
LAKLLIIDDDPELTNMLALVLPSKGFEVSVANSSLEGLNVVRELEPDVIILDLMMPGMNGWRVCQEIRGFSQVPILVLSAIIDADGVMQAMEAGANDYLVKPAPIGVLVSHLNKLIK